MIELPSPGSRIVIIPGLFIIVAPIIPTHPYLAIRRQIIRMGKKFFEMTAQFLDGLWQIIFNGPIGFRISTFLEGNSHFNRNVISQFECWIFLASLFSISIAFVFIICVVYFIQFCLTNSLFFGPIAAVYFLF